MQGDGAVSWPMIWVQFVTLALTNSPHDSFFLGLRKTIQVIAFFAHLKEQGNKGPHLIVVL